MTSNRSFKSRVRARMGKTGERYTAARRQLTTRSAPAAPEQATSDPTPASPEPPATPEPPAAAIRSQRFSDASLRERTGHGWDEWFHLLDEWGATGRRHAEIARWLVTEHAVDGWWSQSITVGYEQARGMRAPGQEPDGTFAANASRTVAAPVEALFDAFTDERTRTRWLPDAHLTVRTATAPKSFRADWRGDHGGRVVVGFTPRPGGKSQVAVQHEKLAGADAAAAMKAYWRERLATLKQLLES